MENKLELQGAESSWKSRLTTTERNTVAEIKRSLLEARGPTFSVPEGESSFEVPLLFSIAGQEAQRVKEEKRAEKEVHGRRKFSTGEFAAVLASHERWMTSSEGKGQRADFKNADLEGHNLLYANLEAANLHYANLRETDLAGSMFRHANLCCANLSGANLKNACLLYADLRSTELEGANLEGTTIGLANLRGANLKGVDLTHTKGILTADFTGAVVEGVTLPPGYAFAEKEEIRVDHGDTMLQVVAVEPEKAERKKISAEELRKILTAHREVRCGSRGDQTHATPNIAPDLSDADVAGGYFAYTNLCFVNFRRSNLAGAYFYSSSLCKAQFEDADLRDAKFNNADLRNANLRGTRLEGADFTDAALMGAEVTGSIIPQIPQGYCVSVFSGRAFLQLREER